MKTIIPKSISTIMLITLAGCSTFVENDRLFNNSRQNLTLTFTHPHAETNYIVNLENGDHTTFSAPIIKVRHHFRVGTVVPELPFIHVSFSTGDWHYDSNPFVFEKAQFRKLSPSDMPDKEDNAVMNLQIQPNGDIYVIPTDSKGVVTRFPPQPRGFPLHPK